MGRFNPEDTKVTLDDLIPAYFAQKVQLDSLEKDTAEMNKKIKEDIASLGTDSYSVGNYTAKVSTQVRESMNEDALVMVLKCYNIPGVIKTKEYVDMEALETYLYNNDAPDGLIADMNTCKVTKEVVQLRVSKAKEKK